MKRQSGTTRKPPTPSDSHAELEDWMRTLMPDLQPIVERLEPGRRPDAPMALVLVPTRELANQVNAVIEPLAQAMGMVTTTIFGGVSQHRQVTALRSGVDIVIACPGRLEGPRAALPTGLQLFLSGIFDVYLWGEYAPDIRQGNASAAFDPHRSPDRRPAPRPR